jgi:hypothetical protein
VKLPGRERMPKHMEIAFNPELLSEMAPHEEIGVPRRAVLRGEDEPIFPLPDVMLQSQYDLTRDRNDSY